MEIFELLNQLNSTHGPSGDECGICTVLQELTCPYADEVTVDTLGNLIVHKRGSGPRLMLSAHMDSIGFIVTHIEKNGFLRVGMLGGIVPKECIYTPLRFRNGARGVIVPEEKADFEKMKLDQCYVDIGASNEAEARTMVRVGDTAIYDTPFFINADKVISPYIDNRVCCAAMVKALMELKTCPNDLYLVFSCQEEVGLRGVKTAAWAIDPAYGIVVDTTDVDDTPGTERCGTAKLGKGAAVKIMDHSVICHPEVVRHMEELAENHGITIQKDIMNNGGTDAGAMHITRSGVKTGGISVPCRYIHTPVEMADLKDVEACVALMKIFMEVPLP